MSANSVIPEPPPENIGPEELETLVEDLEIDEADNVDESTIEVPDAGMTESIFVTLCHINYVT